MRSSGRSSTASRPAIFLSFRTKLEKRMNEGWICGHCSTAKNELRHGLTRIYTDKNERTNPCLSVKIRGPKFFAYGSIKMKYDDAQKLVGMLPRGRAVKIML